MELLSNFKFTIWLMNPFKLLPYWKSLWSFPCLNTSGHWCVSFYVLLLIIGPIKAVIIPSLDIIYLSFQTYVKAILSKARSIILSFYCLLYDQYRLLLDFTLLSKVYFPLNNHPKMLAQHFSLLLILVSDWTRSKKNH